MMHGFGANKDGGPEWVCSQFAAWGYVALRFDYRGCGESGGERGRVVPMEEVADAINAISYMASRPRSIPPDRPGRDRASAPALRSTPRASIRGPPR